MIFVVIFLVSQNESSVVPCLPVHLFHGGFFSPTEPTESMISEFADTEHNLNLSSESIQDNRVSLKQAISSMCFLGLFSPSACYSMQNQRVNQQSI
jgi:hypothetical protein